MDLNNKRAYIRSNDLDDEIKVSVDGNKWKIATVTDISSGGLKLVDAAEYNTGDTLWFDITIRSVLSEFEIMVRGVVRRKALQAGNYVYGIAFVGLSQDKKIRIDESIRNDRPVGGERYHAD